MASSTEAVFERDNLATWYAQRHFQADPGVQQIFYLPTNAPSREIRLLEVNDMISETKPSEALDFGVDVGSAEQHTLYVLDVTPTQWAAVQRGELALPDNWTLDGSREVVARRTAHERRTKTLVAASPIGLSTLCSLTSQRRSRVSPAATSSSGD